MTTDPQRTVGQEGSGRRPHATTPEGDRAFAAWEQMARAARAQADAQAAFEITSEIDVALRELLEIEAAAEETRPRRKGDRHPFWAQKVLRLIEERDQQKGREEKPRTATFCARVLDPLRPLPPHKAWLQENMAEFFEALIRGDSAVVSSRTARRLRNTVLPFAQYLIQRFGDRHTMENQRLTDVGASSLRDVVRGLAEDKTAAEWSFALGRLNEAFAQEMRQHPSNTAERDARRKAMLDLVRGLPKSKAYYHLSAAKREKLDRQLEQLEGQAKRAWHRLHIDPPRHSQRDNQSRGS